MSTSGKKAAQLALGSIPVAVLVMGLKYFAYAVTGSAALYSDALESIVNVIASAVAWWAIRVSFKPADENHPFGHHKAEYFSAVIEGVLIVVAALLIFEEAWQAFRVPHPIDAPVKGLAINGVATVVNAFWAWLLIRAGRVMKSPALAADGKHILSDVVTSVGVIAGLVITIATGWLRADPLLAAAVAVNILWQGWIVINTSVQGLMDRAVEPDEDRRIRDLISLNARGAIEVHDLKTRIAGRATFIEFHLVVPARMTVEEAHVICDRIEAAVKSDIGSARVVIHIEPEEEAKLPPGTGAVPFA